jgi:hypothetical protein
MGTLTRGLMNNQKKADWFSGLTDEKRKGLLLKYKIDKTLLNEDVFLIYDNEHDVCESCEKEIEVDKMRMDDEDGNWFCQTCIDDMNQA